MNALDITDEKMRADALRVQATALIEPLAGAAAETEAAGRIPAALMDRLRSAGLTRLCQPRHFGGAELPLDAAADIISILARGCASSAWVCAVYTDHAFLASLFLNEAGEDIWGQTPEAVISAGYHPTGTAERAGDGWRISGQWQFVSGCDYAEWFILGSFIPAANGEDIHGLFLVPRSEIEIEDNWQVMGLQGTGSKNITVAGCIVPEHRVLTMPEANGGAEIRDSSRGETEARPLYRLPHLPSGPFLFTATGLGIAESLLETSIAQIAAAEAKGKKIADYPTMQMHIAEAAAEIDCARLIVMRDTQASMAAMAEPRPLSVMERARNRRDQAYACRLCRNAVDRLFEAAGARGIFDGHYAQRKFRDMCAVASHISQNWDRSGTEYGEAAFKRYP
ncbi:MAG: acyl-CoA dehydrogenase family protein [Rhodospirillales bacterium]|nr:acyl-CoA dehydrogenase family protein [Rhodospirillales bacterium]